MPRRRLVRDGLIEQDHETYRLAPPFDQLSRWQRLELIALCERRIEEHRAAYADLFSKRTVDAVIGSVRYEALKRAGGRCELCGASHQEKPLHVDHVLPRAKGGQNDLDNLQVLARLATLRNGTETTLIFGPWRPAYLEERLDVAEHLLRALEVLQTDPLFGAELCEAYLSVCPNLPELGTA